MSNEYVFFEDGGQFKAGTILQDQGASLQVEAASGKRSKVKQTSVMLRFRSPEPEEMVRCAHQAAGELDPEFLWEVAPQEEFDFTDLAREYHGHEPGAVELAALLLRLHGSPVYFYRKGKGRYRPAQPETLRAALAAIERKTRQEEQIRVLAAELEAGRLPPEIAARATECIVLRDRQSLEVRALDLACEHTGLSPRRLLLQVGAFQDAHELLRSVFCWTHFPAGRTGFAASLTADFAAPDCSDLPEADGVAAFSVDDRTTTEIDDCLSVQKLDSGEWRLGVHIAAPSLAIAPEGDLDRAIRDRLTTVYAPGEKITMMPAEVVRAYSMDEGGLRPALSLYLDVHPETFAVLREFSRVDRVMVTHNLRQHELDGRISEATLNAGEAPDVPHGADIAVLWQFMRRHAAERERMRGRPEPRFRVDFSFYVQDNAVQIVRRDRDLPMDRIVAEMMIVANSRWGKVLADHGVPGLYRAQQEMGRVRMTTHALPHVGIGVPQYAWSTSPLRRYVDLVNQMQMIALLEGRTPPWAANDTTLFAILSAFETRHATVGEYQQTMERYWCLRWVAQQIAERGGNREFEAVGVRDATVRLVDAPLYFQVPGLPPLAPGQQLMVEILSTDELDLIVEARGIRLIAQVDDSEGSEIADAPAEHPISGPV